MREEHPRLGTILVVDDVEQNRRVAEAQLVSAGYAVMTASSGEAALSSFEERPVDLILLDVLMPGLDGFETCKRIRTLRGGADVPIVFLTALTDLGSHERAMGSGADDFLSKPINRTELLIRVRSLLWVKRLKDELRHGYDIIRSQRDALLTVQRQKEELAALVVHDLKNPLTGILSCSSFLLRAPTLAPELREAVEDVLHSAQAMNRMVLNLLDISRSEDGMLTPRWSEVDLPSLLEDIRSCSAWRALERRQTLTVTPDPEIRTISADPDLLRRILENLLDNAIRYAPTGGRVTMGAQKVDADWIELRVSDDGPGIPTELRERVFEKYVQLERDAGPSIRASRGLGLTFCRLAVELHGGRIWVEDNSPQGTTFCARLPTSR